jgi:hypothetical protein
MTIDRDYFDELQAWVDSFDPNPWVDSDLPSTDPPSVVVAQVDLLVGEFFRTNWRRRLAQAQGDCGYVARQMRKAGVPLDLALAILFTRDEVDPPAQPSIAPPVPPPPATVRRRRDMPFDFPFPQAAFATT